MKNIWISCQIAISTIGGFLSKLLGGYDALIVTLGLLVLLDIFSGIGCAIHEKKLSSNAGFKGGIKKILIFGVIGLANLLDVAIVGQGMILRTAAVIFYISNEGLSLVENSTRLGLPIPDKIKEVLFVLHNKDKGDKQ